MLNKEGYKEKGLKRISDDATDWNIEKKKAEEKVREDYKDKKENW